jgi:hypothetical protein
MLKHNLRLRLPIRADEGSNLMSFAKKIAGVIPRCRERAPSRSATWNATECVPYRHIADFVYRNP